MWRLFSLLIWAKANDWARVPRWGFPGLNGDGDGDGDGDSPVIFLGDGDGDGDGGYTPIPILVPVPRKSPRNISRKLTRESPNYPYHYPIFHFYPSTNPKYQLTAHPLLTSHFTFTDLNTWFALLSLTTAAHNCPFPIFLLLLTLVSTMDIQRFTFIFSATLPPGMSFYISPPFIFFSFNLWNPNRVFSKNKFEV